MPGVLEQLQADVAAIKEAVARLEKLLQASPNRVKDAYSTKEVAQRLSICERSVKAYCLSGDLKSVKRGGRRLILPEAIEEFLASDKAVPVLGKTNGPR